MCKAIFALGKLFFVSLFTWRKASSTRRFFVSLFTWRKVSSTRRFTKCCRTRNLPLVVALGQRKIHVNSDRRQAVHQGKVDPEIDELPLDHVNRPKVVFTLYRIAKQNVAKCVSNRAPVHTGNASSGTTFVLEQDCSAALLKVEHIVSDRFSKRSGSNLNTFVKVKITTGLLIGESETTTTGSRFKPNETQHSLFSHAVLQLLVDRLLSQGYEVKRLRNSFKKFYGRYPDLIGKYQRSVKDMVADSFPD